MKTKGIKTRREAKAFVLKQGVCGIFSDNKGEMACLWEAVDLPGRQPGERGWGQKVVAIWTWKNELPERYPDEIYYGKIPGGLAVLMSMKHLREKHYPACHVPLRKCSALAQRLYGLLKLDPLTTPQLREEAGLTERGERSKFDRALKELQVTLNIVRRHGSAQENDTWVPFREQYLDLVRGAGDAEEAISPPAARRARRRSP